MTETELLELYMFVGQSNYIEGINREPLPEEIEAHKAFLALETVTIADLQNFVSMIAPGNVLRDRDGLNVRVGNHLPLAGGSQLVGILANILLDAVKFTRLTTPFKIHREYESLHPFTDGNGRSGRVLWLWMQKKRGNLARALRLGFMHHWYYDSLEDYDND